MNENGSIFFSLAQKVVRKNVSTLKKSFEKVCLMNKKVQFKE